ncbi:MAG: hypothetical protein ABL907_20660 [Hyphomicrobium sp.]
MHQIAAFLVSIESRGPASGPAGHCKEGRRRIMRTIANEFALDMDGGRIVAATASNFPQLGPETDAFYPSDHFGLARGALPNNEIAGRVSAGREGGRSTHRSSFLFLANVSDNARDLDV